MNIHERSRLSFCTWLCARGSLTHWKGSRLSERGFGGVDIKGCAKSSRDGENDLVGVKRTCRCARLGVHELLGVGVSTG